MCPSFESLDSFYEKYQASTVHYLADVFGYSAGDSECKTCPTIPTCPHKAQEEIKWPSKKN